MTHQIGHGLRAAVLATLAALPLMAAPAMADEATKATNGFKPLSRAVTPGERAAAQSYARPGNDALSAAMALAQGDSSQQTGVSMSVNGNLPTMANGFGSRRSNQLLGDGQIGYDAEPFYSNNRGYYTPYGYSASKPHLEYNESFLRYMYDGNIAGIPSVSAPLDMWGGRR